MALKTRSIVLQLLCNVRGKPLKTVILFYPLPPYADRDKRDNGNEMTPPPPVHCENEL